MSSIQTKQFNWLSSPSAWQQMENWRAKNRAAQDQADSVYASSIDNFSSAITDLGSGLATIAAQRASDRVNAAIKAKSAAQQVDLTA